MISLAALKKTFAQDALASVVVFLVALPLCMGIAIASGVPPQAGLYCAVVAGFLISALGGSSTQIGGPTGAFVVVVFGIVARYGIDGLYMCTLLAGVMLVILGATGLHLKVMHFREIRVNGKKQNTQLQNFLTSEKNYSASRIGEVGR